MSVWENRVAGFEKRQEIEAGLRFKAQARRNKLVGLWAAREFGMAELVATNYARQLVESEVGQDDDEALAQRLELQFAKLEMPISAHRIRRKIAEMTALAAREIFDGR